MKREIEADVLITDIRITKLIIQLISGCGDFEAPNLADYSTRFEQVR